MRAPYLKTGLAAGFTLLASTHLSFALDADDFAKKFAAAYASQGANITYDGVSADGDTITLKDVDIEMPGEDDGLDLGDLTFNGVKEDGSGGYTAESFTNDEIKFSEDDNELTISDLKVENLRIPGEPGAESVDDIMWYDSATTGPIALTIEGQDVFKAARSTTTTKKSSDGSRMDFDARIDGLEIDLSDVKDAQAQQAINGMGYQTLSGDVVLNGHWAPETGEIALTEYALTLDDVGRLDMQFSISGYTLEFIKGLQQMQEQMAKQDDDGKSQQAMGLAMMGMMQQLTFNSLSVRFDDASLTNKVLDMVASRQGMSRDQMVQGLQGMMPLLLAQLQNPEFQKQVTEAVSLYLSDPKSIEITAQPEAPLPFASVAGSAMGAPQTLPQVLNVSVTANQ
ncbi:hypothetical protein [Hoeflea prorocentri]|uniref:DUF945 domain-containing protein n=1 Tax=Hoeflea prorocentri TaxID=1922333 RepID=A0A9X3UJ66_9HYPH|nr:hypothetical protein [Hoeflea prorocentri]MCY6380119.1 hypothetical protein [Hoeflea prorocentri]MDA5397919.1 hypothetical protein [Hoeflea prorocentri]